MQHNEIPSLLKIQNISLAWWLMHMVPATQEAGGGSLEPTRSRLQGSLVSKTNKTSTAGMSQGLWTVHPEAGPLFPQVYHGSKV